MFVCSSCHLYCIFMDVSICLRLKEDNGEEDEECEEYEEDKKEEE